MVHSNRWLMQIGCQCQLYDRKEILLVVRNFCWIVRVFIPVAIIHIGSTIIAKTKLISIVSFYSIIIFNHYMIKITIYLPISYNIMSRANNISLSNHIHNKNIPIFSPSLSSTKLCGNCYTCLNKEYHCKLTFNMIILSNQVKVGLILATKMSVH